MNRTSTTSSASVRIANLLAATLFALVPFHAFLTVWGSTLFGHYVVLRLWNGVFLAMLTAIGMWWLVRDSATRRWLVSNKIAHIILLYTAVTFVVTGVAYWRGGITAMALAYGVFVNLRYLAFFLLVWALARKSNWLKRHWIPLVLGPAVVVCVVALMQYFVLPADVMKHFGYADYTIPPYETINNNPEFIRVASTLRGANPLGAYLALIVGSLAALLLAAKAGMRRGVLVGMSLVVALALLVSFSRSGWLGAFVAAALVWFGWLKTTKTRRIFWFVLLGVIIFTVVTFTAFQNNRAVQNAVFHTDDQSSIETSSNEARWSHLTTALEDVRGHPLGGGAGSAGPASVYNVHSKIAENYFLQIGQETGWVGLGLYLTIVVAVAQRLWRFRTDLLVLACFGGLVGLSLIAMLSHSWTDETVAYLWWGLAGIALGDAEIVKPAKVRKHRA